MLLAPAALAKMHDPHEICEMVCMPGEHETLEKCKPGEGLVFESNGTCFAQSGKCPPGFQKRTVVKPATLKNCGEAKCRKSCRKPGKQ